MPFCHLQCYARHLGDCSDVISREHYISRSVLERVGKAVQVTGMPWQGRDDVNNIGTSSLTAKILCERHNALLSPLDKVAGKFVAELYDTHALAMDGNMPAHTCSVSGASLERWFLKVLVGLFHLSDKFSVPNAWIEFLFDRRPWPDGQGMYIFGALGSATWNLQLLRVIPVFQTDDNSKIRGAKFGLGGLPFLLAFGTPRFEEVGIDATFRPSTLQFCQRTNVRELQLLWEDREQHEAISLHIDGSVDCTSEAPRPIVLPLRR